MFFARNVETPWLGPRGDEKIAGGQFSLANTQPIGAGKACGAMQRGDASLFVSLLMLFWHRISEAALEIDKFGPVDPDVPCNSVGSHASLRIDHFDAGHQHFFGVTTSKCASPAKGFLIDNRNAFTGFRYTHRAYHRRCSCPDYCQIIVHIKSPDRPMNLE